MVDQPDAHLMETKWPRRWLALVLAFISPLWGMLYLGRGWRAVAYEVVSDFAIVSRLDRSGWLTAIFALAIRLFCLFDANSILRGRRYPRAQPWFARYGALSVPVLLFSLIVGFRILAYQPYYIPSEAMKPTLLVGDYVLASKFAYGYSKHSLPFDLPLFEGRLFGRLPERGDVAVFKLPSDNSTDYIKRIVGLPGDRIQVRDGVL
jgi:Signal peptidase, peptidase S26